jgi:hypothetical protein
VSLTKKDFLSGVAVLVYQDRPSVNEENVPVLKFYGVDEAGRVYEGEQTPEADVAKEKVKFSRSPVSKEEVVTQCVFVGMDSHPFPLRKV